MRFLPTSPEPVSAWRWTPAEPSRDLVGAIALSRELIDCFGPSGLIGRYEPVVGWRAEDGATVPWETLVMRPRATPAEAFAERILGSRPAVTPDLRPARLSFLGEGSVLLPEGKGSGRTHDGLIEVRALLHEEHLQFEVRVYHDIWAERDFFGTPQPEVHELNAPRLAAGLEAVEQVLGFPGTPGGPTFFGTPYNYGVSAHVADDGAGIDVSDRL
ncbi:hypothetical protein LG943_10320 [Streptomonospora sp. S1-112]|uniref:Uncharacterized protein n=1 Tax=Streptomonospora mangrovi TaxID=2883123 RepID=A0A9X3SH07_9ACTN|nr:hypothetical protein [Streptomonospora mangrovi]MDA0564719.1 hypothetical protein [Streptomonospora mangrovi]